MRLDNITRRKSGEYTFRYFCPKTLAIRTVKNKIKSKAKAKWNAIKILQGQTPESPTASLTPFKIVIEKYIESRLQDIAGGRLRESSWYGYYNHITRLFPLAPEPITETKDGYQFRYFNKKLNKFLYYRTPHERLAQRVWQQKTLAATTSDPLHAQKTAALNAPIKELRWELIQNILDNIPGSQSTRKHHFVTYTNIVTWAIKKGYLSKTDSDLIAAARPGTGAKKQMEIPSEESVKLLIENSEGIWKAFWSIAVTTGIRLGELTALPWKNVHLNEGRIYVGQSTQRNGKISQPKTMNAYRELPISRTIINLLSELSRDTELVFPCPEFGLPYKQKNKWHQVFMMPPRRLREPNEVRPMCGEEPYRMGLQPILRAHNIPWKGRIHSLRHFAASRMIDLNWNIKKIQTRMGHASAQTTLDIYGHLMDRQTFHEEAEQLSDGLF